MIDYEIEFYTKKDRIIHENILKCYGYYEDDENHYLVLELCALDIKKLMPDLTEKTT